MKQLITLGVLCLITFSWVSGASAQATIQVTHNEAVLRFPDGIRFELSASSEEAIESILLVYRTSGRSCQLREVRQPINFTPGTDLKVELMWDWERSGILPPGAQVEWHWEIKDAKGNLHRTPEETLQVIDQRRKWKTIKDEKIALSWYSGNDEFGQELYQIADSGLQKLHEEFGIQPDGVAYITVYASTAALRDALQSSTRWVGGVAFPQHNSMLIAVGPEELDWAAELIPHELTHLVIGVLTFNCRGASLPTWLEEGLAEVIQAPVSSLEMDEVQKALRTGHLPPLKSLEGSFSAYGDEARLAYMQSKYVADYLITTYGKEDLHLLLATIQTGAHIDAALQEVYGFNTHQLDAEWRAEQGFDVTPMPEHASNTPTVVPTLQLISPITFPTETPEPASGTPTETSHPAGEETSSPVPTAAASAAPEDQTPSSSPSFSIIALIILAVITGPTVYGFVRWRQSHLTNI
jgi:hypothetical protein